MRSSSGQTPHAVCDVEAGVRSIMQRTRVGEFPGVLRLEGSMSVPPRCGFLHASPTRR